MVADIFSGLCSPNYFSDVTILALTLKKKCKISGSNTRQIFYLRSNLAL